MITAVDTNVLLDVVGADPTFGPASASALRTALRQGQLLSCEVVWARLRARFPLLRRSSSMILSVERPSFKDAVQLVDRVLWPCRLGHNQAAAVLVDFQHLAGPDSQSYPQRLRNGNLPLFQKPWFSYSYGMHSFLPPVKPCSCRRSALSQRPHLPHEIPYATTTYHTPPYLPQMW